MKTDPKHEQKREAFDLACEKLICVDCEQPRAAESTLSDEFMALKSDIVFLSMQVKNRDEVINNMEKIYKLLK